MADKKSRFGFKTPKDAEQGVLNLKKMREDDTYKIRVALGVINRAKATMDKTPDPIKDKEILQSIAIWEKFIKHLKKDDEDDTGEDLTKKGDYEDDGFEDAGRIDMGLGDRNIITAQGDDRGLVVKLTQQGGYSIYYWEGDPGQRTPSEVYLDKKKVYMPVRLVHMGFEIDGYADDDVGRMQEEKKPQQQDPAESNPIKEAIKNKIALKLLDSKSS